MDRKGLIIIWLESATAYCYLEEERCPSEIYRHVGGITTRRGLKHLTNYPIFGYPEIPLPQILTTSFSQKSMDLVFQKKYQKRGVCRLYSAAGLAKYKKSRNERARQECQVNGLIDDRFPEKTPQIFDEEFSHTDGRWQIKD